MSDTDADDGISRQHQRAAHIRHDGQVRGRLKAAIKRVLGR